MIASSITRTTVDEIGVPCTSKVCKVSESGIHYWVECGNVTPCDPHDNCDFDNISTRNGMVMTHFLCRCQNNQQLRYDGIWWHFCRQESVLYRLDTRECLLFKDI